MPFSKSLLRLLSVMLLPLVAGHAAGDEPRRQRNPFGAPALTSKQETAYGNRADFFRGIPAEYRPDVDWRSALSESLADVEPRWSQGFEELIVRDFFGDREQGFYVDVGCNLPRKNSTTYDLEQRLGWTGVGIDVIARYGESWKRVRPRSTFVHAAVSSADGEKLQLHIAGAYATLEKQLIEDLGMAKLARTIEVETSTLDTLLGKQGVEKIDFLSMDIEGAGLAALKGFDIQRFQPALCCIEPSDREAVVEYFESKGYELIEKYLKADKINLYFSPKQAE